MSKRDQVRETMRELAAIHSSERILCLCGKELAVRIGPRVFVAVARNRPAIEVAYPLSLRCECRLTTLVRSADDTEFIRGPMLFIHTANRYMWPRHMRVYASHDDPAEVWKKWVASIGSLGTSRRPALGFQCGMDTPR